MKTSWLKNKLCISVLIIYVTSTNFVTMRWSELYNALNNLSYNNIHEAVSTGWVRQSRCLVPLFLLLLAALSIWSGPYRSLQRAANDWASVRATSSKNSEPILAYNIERNSNDPWENEGACERRRGEEEEQGECTTNLTALLQECSC